MKDTKIIDTELAALAEPEQEQEKEIAPGMTVEEIRAVYFNADALKEPAYRLYQLNSEGYRYYYRFNEAGEPEFYPSVTTLLKQVMPTPPALLDWMIANGKDGSAEKRDLAAAYGTFMHGEFEKLIINRRYDFDSVPAALLAYMERENLPEKVFSEWSQKIRKDVLAFAQFVRDWNVRPLAVEIGLYHPKYHYAGCLDLPCGMTDPKSGKSFTAIVDFKSGRKGFYEEHELQLHLYADMWNANYPDLPAERVFNFSPKDWRTKPSYNLKDQTDSVNAKKLPYLLALATIEDEKRDNTLTIVRGVLSLDEGNISDNILTLSLAELVKTKADEKEAPEQAAKAPEPINTPSEPQKAVKTEIDEKQLIRAGGPLTAYDICELYCKEKNCDYCLGTHEPKCEQAMKRAGRKYNDPDIFPIPDANEKLPWEKDMEKGTGIEVAKMAAGLKVKSTYHEPIRDKKPVNVDSEMQAIEALERVARENLLNSEMEL